MPFSIIKSESTNRFIEVSHLLNTIKNIEDSIIPPALSPIEYKIFKGLFYVHLYACIEFSINNLILKTLSLINNKNILHQHFDIKFNTIALSSNLQSVRDCNSKAFLDKSAELFLKSISNNIANFDETFIQKYLQNIWGKTFNQLTQTLGISTFAISPRTILTFNEIVEKRNSVAHGRETAESVGASPKYADLKSKYDLVYEIITLYIEHYEIFYNNKEYIISTQRSNY